MDEPQGEDFTREPYELLNLLQDIIARYVECFVHRFDQSYEFRDRSAIEPILEGSLSLKRLKVDLRDLRLLLEEFNKQDGSISQELYAATLQVAGSLERTLHGSRIQEVVIAEKLESLLSSKNDHVSSFTNLKDFRVFALQIPKSRQTTVNNRPIVKNISIQFCQSLSSQISAFNSLLWEQNPQSELIPASSKIPIRRKLRYSSMEEIPKEIWEYHGIDELHTLLCRYWPCPCGKNHDRMLGSCMDIMLCLQSGWTHPGRAAGEFEILFQIDQDPIYCDVSFKTESPTKFSTPILNDPCQILFDGVKGMKLKIVATQAATAGFTAEFGLDSVSASASGCCVTLQGLLDEGVILQLLGSPWLQEYWDGADISFFQMKHEGAFSFNYRQPYLSACWLKAQERVKLGKLLEGYHPMPDMVTLARFLLELELQDTRFSPLLVQDLRSDLLKANRLLSALKELDRNLWGRALFIESMEACLDINTYKAVSSESGPHLLWEIYDKVVSPLELNLLSMLGPEATLNDLDKELSGVSQCNATLEIEPNAKSTQSSIPINTASDEWFQKLEADTQNMMETVSGGTVSVAILDTGIDVSHPLIKDKIATEDCWDFVTGTGNICDEVGHGTHTAYLLTKTAPRTRIFCGRVWRTRTEEENTAKLVEQAITHAVKQWGVQIIVMPFAFPHRDDDITEAIEYAHSRKVLLFAAASNKTDINLGFPAFLPEVICIYSNKSTTTSSTFCKLGKEGKNNFSIIGEQVEGAWPMHLNNGKQTKRETGTSCSTPIAAGVAALILEYAMQKGRFTVARARELRKKQFMERIMLKCMTECSTTGVYNLLEPWRLLSTRDGKNPRTLNTISSSISQQIKEISPD